ncbi:MAG TPA: class I SAM-dependent methyltransferase [Chlamydiales bacterium]|nr:class I SAM-dependent methyltransferase [Chlamydiales bacterium]
MAKTIKKNNACKDVLPGLHKSFPNDTLENAQNYANSGFENTYFLAYRDIPFFLEKYTTGKRAIDYGCGAGRSTRFLKDYGFEVIGVDVSKKMLEQAIRRDQTTHYLQIVSSQIPVLSDTCDLIFSCFVMLTIQTKQELLAIFKEIYRCLKVGGIFMFVTASEELFSHKWLSYCTDYPQNRNLKSGDAAKILLKDLGIEFTDYFWTDKDYTTLFLEANFKRLETHFPMGKLNEGWNWLSEIKYAPYVIYVLKKE